MAISDLMVLSSDNSSTAAPAGWTRLDQDLNDGAGGRFIYLAYRDTQAGPFIVDITFVVGDSAEVATPAGYTRLPQDLNEGSGGKFIYLCYRRGEGLPITNLGVTRSGAPLPYGDGPFYTLIPQDLNQGAKGRYLYLNTGRYSSRWMQDLAPYIADRPLNRIALPGTHDSGTHSLSSSAEISRDAKPKVWAARNTPGINSRIYDWALAQNLSIADQLQAGIRYLDIRVLDRRQVDSSGDVVADRQRELQIHVVHSMFGAPIDDVFAQVDSFLRKNPREILILRLGTNCGDALTARGKTYLINELLRSRLGDLMAPRSLGPQVTPAQLWAAGKRLIVLVDTAIWADMNPGAETEWVWNEEDDASRSQYRGMVLGSDLDADGAGKLKDLKRALDRQQARTWLSAQKFQRLGCCLTPDDTTVITGSATDYLDSWTSDAFSGLVKATTGTTIPKSLHQGCAMAATPAAGRWMRSDWQYETVNIITTDFFQIAQVVDLCLLRNLRPRRFYLATQPNGLVVDLPKEATQPGTRPMLWPRNTPQTRNQQWILDPSGHIRSLLAPDMVLDVEGAKAAPGTPVILWPEAKPAAQNQLWDVDAQGHIRSRLDPTLVLDVKDGGMEQGAQLIIWTEAKPAAQNQVFLRFEV